MALAVRIKNNKNRVRLAKSPLLIVQRRLKRRCPESKMATAMAMATQILRLKQGMKEMKVQQVCIKQRQRQVGRKLEAIESECEALRAETLVIMKQSACTRVRLALMFLILKARENKDFAKAAHFTLALRSFS